MTNKEILKKQIIYRSSHRGSKEMDILLSSFVKSHINILNDDELKELSELLFLDDEVIHKWYFYKIESKRIVKNKVTKLFRNFKL